MRRSIALLGLVILAAACARSTTTPPVTTPAVFLDSSGVEYARYDTYGVVGQDQTTASYIESALLNDERLGPDEAARRATLSSDGIVVQTSLDASLQDRIRDILQALLPPNVDGPAGAVVALDRATGAVRAIALSEPGQSPGGIDVLFGTGRPTGSALKPFALAAALDFGLTLETRFPAPKCITLPDDPTDQTCGGSDKEETLLDATIHSLNPVYVQVIDAIGVKQFARVVSEVGISSGSSFETIDAVLGRYPVSVLEMAAAFRAIAESGRYVPPYVVTDLKLSDGSTYRTDNQGPQVLSPEIWSQVDSVLRLVVEEGTGQAANPGFQVAGKTGTARELTDAWFVGYTDELVVAVWVGFTDDPTRPMVFPATPITVTGGSWPAEIWRYVVSDQ